MGTRLRGLHSLNTYVLYFLHVRPCAKETHVESIRLAFIPMDKRETKNRKNKSREFQNY
jgi:hypothetical protein